MISAYAQAALVLGDERYAAIAGRAADFVMTAMRKDGRLLRSYKDGVARHRAYLDDYAFMIAGLLDLYEATGELRWLQQAAALDEVLAAHYEDREAGGFFMTGDDHEALLAREKPNSDGAEPSGNSVQALNLLRLHELTTDDRYRQRAVRTLRAFGETLRRAPAALSDMLLAVDYQLDAPKEIVIVMPASRADAEPLLAELRRTFVPNRALIVASEGPPLAAQAASVPLLDGKTARGGRPTAYVCKHRVCALPTAQPEVFAQQLRSPWNRWRWPRPADQVRLIASLCASSHAPRRPPVALLPGASHSRGVGRSDSVRGRSSCPRDPVGRNFDLFSVERLLRTPAHFSRDPAPLGRPQPWHRSAAT